MGRDGQVIDWAENYFGTVYGHGVDYYDLSEIPASRYIELTVRMPQIVEFNNIEIESASVATIELDAVLPETDFVPT